MDDTFEQIHMHDRSLLVYRKRPQTMYQVLSQSAYEHPDRIAIISNEHSITYGELQQRVDRLSEHLIHTLKLEQGDRIGLLFPNVPEFCELLLAAAKTGIIAVLLNTRLTPRELSFMIEHSDSKLLIYDAEYEEKAMHLMRIFPTVRFLRFGGDGHNPELFSYESMMSEDLPVTLTESASETDPCYMMYTSGTTGVPKGALTLHMNVIHSAMNYMKVCGTKAADRTLIAVPLFHVTGLIGQFIHMLLAGGTSVLLQEYSTDAFIKTAIRHRVTFMFNVPAIYNLLLLKGESAQIDSMRLALYGGAPMSPETITKLRELYPGLVLRNVYGATETSSPTTIMPDNWTMEKIHSIGKPVPGSVLKIVDEKGGECMAEQVGELWISGAMVIPEYWKNEEANRSLFVNGFWKSGDMAMRDMDGYVYIMDRKKDIINRGGEKIYSVEIENILYSHPGILEAAVIGVTDDIFGEQIKAFVVAKGGQALSEEEIKSFVNMHLADYKVPKYIEFVSAIPRNPGGKIMKHLLRQHGSKENIRLDGTTN